MTQEETFQKLKLAYITKAKAHLKALKGLSLENYLDMKNHIAIGKLRKDSVHSGTNLSAFIVKEVADRAVKKGKLA
jgi:hypothetical protein